MHKHKVSQIITNRCFSVSGFSLCLDESYWERMELMVEPLTFHFSPGLVLGTTTIDAGDFSFTATASGILSEMVLKKGWMKLALDSYSFYTIFIVFGYIIHI